MDIKPWEDFRTNSHCQLIAQSYFNWFRKPILSKVEKNVSDEELSYQLFYAPFILVSHGTESDPIFNYANDLALKTWKMSREEFVGLPSRFSVDRMETEDREKLLDDALKKGFVDNYSGIRITKTNERFKIRDTVLFNLIDQEENYKGQAALITKWEFL